MFSKTFLELSFHALRYTCVPKRSPLWIQLHFVLEIFTNENSKIVATNVLFSGKFIWVNLFKFCKSEGDELVG